MYMTIKLRKGLLILLCLIVCVYFSSAAFAEEADPSEVSPVMLIFYSIDDSALDGLHVMDTSGVEYEPLMDEESGEVLYGRYSLMPGNYRFNYHDDAGRYEDTMNVFTLDKVFMRFIQVDLAPLIDVQNYSLTVINPIYADVVTAADIPQPTISQEELEAEAIRLAKQFSGVTSRRKTAMLTDTGKVNTSIQSAGSELKQQLMRHEATAIIRINVSGRISSQTQFDQIVNSIYSAAIAHTGAPTEGDYLRCEYGGYNAGGSVSYTTSANVSTCVITYTLSYYSTISQEAQVDSAAANVLSSLKLSGKSDYQKVRAIYEYLCANVSYDYANLNNDAYTLKYTAYAALVNHKAVCQGYACAFYRLCLAAGVNTRIMTSAQMCHAWNIARVNGVFYELDATWDAGYKPSTYRFFLKGSRDWLSGHKYNGISVIGDEYNASGYSSSHPLSSRNFENLAAVPVNSQPVALRSAVKNLYDIFSAQTAQMANGANDIDLFRISVSTKEVGSTDGDDSRSYDTAVSVGAYKNNRLLTETVLDQSGLSSSAVYSFSVSVPAGWSGKQVSFTRSGWGSAKEKGTIMVSTGSAPTVTFNDIQRLGRFTLEPQKYTLTFNTGGGSFVEAQNLVGGSRADKPADPTRSGYWFAGWYTSSNYTTVYNFDSTVSSNTTAYAKWAAIESTPAELKDSITDLDSILSEQASKVSGGAGSIDRFVVSLSAKAGSSNDAGSDYDVAVSVAAYKDSSMLTETLLDQASLTDSAQYSFTLSVPESWNGKTVAYTRSGWGSEDESGTVTVSDSSVAFSGVSKLGHYMLKPMYTVTFETSGGSAIEAQSVVTGETAAKPADPVKSGSWFVGWFADSDCSTAFRFDSAVTADTTVFAKWATPDFVLPSSLTEIEDGAFEGGTFTFAVVPEQTTSIGYHAFADCSKLAYICIPGNASIQYSAFENVYGLTIIGASDTVKSFAESHNYGFIPLG